VAGGLGPSPPPAAGARHPAALLFTIIVCEDSECEERCDKRHCSAPVQHHGERRVVEIDRRGSETDLDEKEDHHERAYGKQEARRIAPPPSLHGDRDDEREQDESEKAMGPFPQRPAPQGGEERMAAHRPIGARQSRGIDARPTAEEYDGESHEVRYEGEAPQRDHWTLRVRGNAGRGNDTRRANSAGT
jgi:hypothetical protein